MDNIGEKGRGVFTTLKIKRGTALFLEQHVERLLLHSTSLEMQIDLEQIKKNVKHLLLQNNVKYAALRINVLEDKITFDLKKLPLSKPDITAVTYKVKLPLPQIKQIDRTIYNDAKLYAKKHNAENAIFVENGFLLESTISNIVSLGFDGNLITPSLKTQGLKGITRQMLIEKGILKEKEILEATQQPLVLINSLRLQSIKMLNGRKIKDASLLIKKLKNIIDAEEKAYENSYYR